MVHYFELCGGKNVKVPKPPKASLRQQRKRVEACITSQVAVRHTAALACLLCVLGGSEHSRILLYVVFLSPQLYTAPLLCVFMPSDLSYYTYMQLFA